MCVCWPRLCVGSHVLCSIIYVIVGAIQLIAGIFFFISLPVFKIGSNIWTGVWNVVAGVGGAVFSCVGDLNANKQQVLLYLTISVLVLNVINLVVLELGEWRILMPDSVKTVIEKQNLQTLVLYARMMTSISTGVAVFTSFFDAQFMFCWLEHNLKPRNRLDHNETVSDIEYIIPRVKSASNNSQGDTGRANSNSHNVYNQYAQSWVFDTDTVGSSQSDSPYSKLQQFNGSKTVVLKRKTKKPDCEQISNTISQTTSTKSKSQPMVLVEDTAADNDRQLQFMTSFSRTPSPVGHNSDSSTPISNSSPASPSSNPPMIYKCLERLTEPSVYKSRLNTALVINAERTSPCVSPRPHSVVISDQVQYASLMVELEKTIVAKFPSHKTPDNRSESATRQSSRRASSRDETSTFQRNIPTSNLNQSDTDFSKELEAALQLIQDLESPNTAEMPLDHPVSIPSSYHTDDEPTKPRCLVSQMTEGSTGTPEIRSNSDNSSNNSKSDGKINDQSKFCYLHHAYCNDCYYITSKEQRLKKFYESPNDINCPALQNNDKNHGYELPFVNQNSTGGVDLLTSSKLNGHYNGNEQFIANKKPNFSYDEPYDGIESSKINYDDIDINDSNDDDDDEVVEHYNNSYSNSLTINNNNSDSNHFNSNVYINNTVTMLSEQKPPQENDNSSSSSSTSVFTKMKSLLKSKGQAQPLLSRKNKKLILTPELESAILKSESLVHLTEVELIQRYNRNKTLHRKIEEKVWQQMNGAPNSDTSC